MRLDALAQAVGARLVGPGDRVVTRAAPLDGAGPSHLSALLEARWRGAAAHTGAGAVVVSPALAEHLPADVARLVADDARGAWGRALRCLHPGPALRPPAIGAHPTAVIDPSAHIDPGARIGPFVVIGAEAAVEAGAALHAHVVVGAGARIGARATLHPGAAVLDGCVVGADALLGVRAVVGGVGFGLDAEGRVPHTGVAVIGAGATLGAHTCVDRATVGVTRVGPGAHLDNLVQVGHNAVIGAGAVLCGQVGVAGGAILEDGVVLGGQAGVTGHVTVGAGARVAAQSGVTRSLPGGAAYSGHPAEPNRVRLRRIARLRALVRP